MLVILICEKMHILSHECEDSVVMSRISLKHGMLLTVEYGSDVFQLSHCIWDADFWWILILNDETEKQVSSLVDKKMQLSSAAVSRWSFTLNFSPRIWDKVQGGLLSIKLWEHSPIVTKVSLLMYCSLFGTKSYVYWHLMPLLLFNIIFRRQRIIRNKWSWLIFFSSSLCLPNWR